MNSLPGLWIAMHLANAVGFGCVLVVNGLAGSTSQIGGMRTGDVARKFRTFCDPSGYAFSIWGVIYTAMGFYVVLEPKLSPTFLAICASNISWLYLWGCQSFMLSQPLLYAYLGLTYLHYTELAAAPASTIPEQIAFTVFPALHVGWLICASTVSTPLIALALAGIATPGALAGALLFVPLAATRFLVSSRIAVGVSMWAVLAVYKEQQRRLRNNESLPASPLVANTCLAILAVSAAALLLPLH
jgi:hypothetical protein